MSNCNRTCKFMHFYCHYNDIYLYAYMLLKLWRSSFRFKVQHTLLKALRNGWGKGGKIDISLRSVTQGALKKAFFSVTYFLNGPLWEVPKTEKPKETSVKNENRTLCLTKTARCKAISAFGKTSKPNLLHTER